MLKSIFSFFCFFFLFFHSFVWGKGALYEDVGLRPISTYLVKDLEVTFQKFGLSRIYVPNEGSRLLGLNLLFSDPFSNIQVALKYDVKGSFEIGKIYNFGKYKVIHFLHEQKNIAFLSKNLDKEELFRIIDEIKNNSKKSTRIGFVSNAYAEDCTSPSSPKINLDFQLNDGINAKSLGECFSSFSVGATDSSVGFVQGMFKDLGNLIQNPKQTLDQYYSFATKGLEALWEFSTTVGKVLMNPDSIPSTLENKYGEFGKFIEKTFYSIKALPAQAKMNIMCNLLGSLGVDFILASVTLGAGSGKIMLTASQIISKINKIIKLIGKGISFNSRYVFSLSDDLLDELQIIDDIKQLELLGNKLNKIGGCDFAIR
jgi:hypothetical protein